MNQASLRAPYEFSEAVLSLAPVAGNGVQNGAGIDKTGYSSLIADVSYACSGGPSGGAMTLQLQDSVDGVAFANFGAPVVGTIGASGIVSLAADITGARQFVRVVSNGAPTGGTSPAVTSAGTVRLFGPDRLPAA